MPGTSLNKVKFLKRPIKPVALGVMLGMAVLCYFNFVGDDRLDDMLTIHAVTLAAGVSAAMFMAGWLSNSVKLVRYAFLLATFVWLERSLFLLFDTGPDGIAIYIGVANAIITGGSYFLESTDPGDS